MAKFFSGLTQTLVDAFFLWLTYLKGDHITLCYRREQL